MRKRDRNGRLDEELYSILCDESLDEEATEESKVERIEDLCSVFSWIDIQDHLFSILLDDKASDHWRTIAEVFFGAVLDGRDIQENRLIALLHYRLRPTRDIEDNLVWSITAKIKNLDYLSEYEPLDDPAIGEEIEVLRKESFPQ